MDRASETPTPDATLRGGASASRSPLREVRGLSQERHRRAAVRPVPWAEIRACRRNASLATSAAKLAHALELPLL